MHHDSGKRRTVCGWLSSASWSWVRRGGGGSCRFWIYCCVGGGEVTVFVWEEAYNFDEFIHQPADLIPGTAWVANLGVTCCGLTDLPA